MTTPYINGAQIEVDPAAMTPVVNPASGKSFSKIFMARPEHMTRAIDAAYAVKDVWGNTTALRTRTDSDSAPPMFSSRCAMRWSIC